MVKPKVLELRLEIIFLLYKYVRIEIYIMS